MDISHVSDSKNFITEQTLSRVNDKSVFLQPVVKPVVRHTVRKFDRGEAI